MALVIPVEHGFSLKTIWSRAFRRADGETALYVGSLRASTKAWMEQQNLIRAVVKVRDLTEREQVLVRKYVFAGVGGNGNTTAYIVDIKPLDEIFKR